MKKSRTKTIIWISGIIILAGIIMSNTLICKTEKKDYSDSPNYEDGKFKNTHLVDMSMSFKDMMSSAKKYFSPDEEAAPANAIPVEKVDPTSFAKYSAKEPRLIWFGHSTFLLQIEGKNLLIDPMLGDVPAPKSWLGKPRFSKELPISIDDLPQLDAVIISHDHYDHLDKESIKQIKDKVNAFYTPLGVSKHLVKWGVAENLIHELDWWEQINLDKLQFTCAPAQHFSGRGVSDSQSTLWCSWIIASDSTKIFFSGDSGYNSHFAEIGEKHGPFDIALMECGQYNEKWEDIHMFPEQSVQAAIDVKAKVMMPIHWGGFTLSEHAWKDPIDRAVLQAAASNVKLATPGIGEPLIIGTEDVSSTTQWWKQY